MITSCAVGCTSERNRAAVSPCPSACRRCESAELAPAVSARTGGDSVWESKPANTREAPPRRLFEQRAVHQTRCASSSCHPADRAIRSISNSGTLGPGRTPRWCCGAGTMIAELAGVQWVSWSESRPCRRDPLWSLSPASERRSQVGVSPARV